MPARRTQRSHTRSTPPDPPTTKLDDVRDKVRRFILNQTSIGEFYDSLRRAAGNDELAPHPLTGLRFRKIVTDVIRTRKTDAEKRSEPKERKKRS